MVSKVSNTKQIEFLENIGKIGAVVGSPTSLAYVMLGRDYTYPCTVAASGAFTWLCIWINKSAQEKTEKTAERPLKDRLKEHVDGVIDEVASDAKTKITNVNNRVVDACVTVAKATALTSLPAGVGACVGSSLEAVGKSTKAISNKGIGYSVDSTGKSAKSCVTQSLNYCSDKS